MIPLVMNSPLRNQARCQSLATPLTRTVVLCLLMLTGSILTGCATIGRAVFTEPVVELRTVRPSSLGLDGGTLDVVLTVHNPNKYALDGTRFTYKLSVDSVLVGEGELTERFVVARGDSALVTLPVRFTYRGLGAAGRQLLMNGTVRYRVHGDFSVNTPLGGFTRPYDRVGAFSPNDSRSR